MANGFGQLIVQLGGNVVQTYPLAGEVVHIGRTPDNDLVLAHPLVSRRHAELRLGAEGVTLTDLGSSNGTFIDSVRLLENQPHTLSNDTVIQIGPFLVRYQEPSAAEDAGAADAIEPEQPVEAVPVEPVPIDFSPVEVRPLAPPRPTFPTLPPVGPWSEYLRDLPIIYQESDFLGRFLLIFESLWEPLEIRQDHIDMYFDPRTSPASFLPWLANWLDVTLNLHWPEQRMRFLLAEAMELYRWRGTRYGLSRMIEVCTGITPTITEDAAEPLMFRVTISLPPDGDVDRRFIEELIQTHKPAHVGYVLEVTA